MEAEPRPGAPGFPELPDEQSQAEETEKAMIDVSRTWRRARKRTRAGIQPNGRLEKAFPDGRVGIMPSTSSRTGLQQNSGRAARGLAELRD